MNPENKTSVTMALAKMVDYLIEIDGVNHVKFKNGALMPLSFDYTAQTAQSVDEWVEKWEDLKMVGGYYVYDMSSVFEADKNPAERHNENVFATKDQAEASIAVAQLTQLLAQPCVNGDWKPDWIDDLEKWVIRCSEKKFSITSYTRFSHFLAFKDESTAEKFLDMYEDYIIKAAPILFGVTL